jgi:hypothetical protein
VLASFDELEVEPQVHEPVKTSYGQKVFDMVKGINVEFRKKKKVEEEGTKTRNKRKWGNMEEKKRNLSNLPFLSRSNHVSSSTCHTGRS